MVNQEICLGFCCSSFGVIDINCVNLCKFSFNEFYMVLLNKSAACALRVAKILPIGLGGVCGVWLLHVPSAFRTLILVSGEHPYGLCACGLLLRH